MVQCFVSSRTNTGRVMFFFSCGKIELFVSEKGASEC